MEVDAANTGFCRTTGFTPTTVRFDICPSWSPSGCKSKSSVGCGGNHLGACRVLRVPRDLERPTSEIPRRACRRLFQRQPRPWDGRLALWTRATVSENEILLLLTDNRLFSNVFGHRVLAAFTTRRSFVGPGAGFTGSSSELEPRILRYVTQGPFVYPSLCPVSA